MKPATATTGWPLLFTTILLGSLATATQANATTYVDIAPLFASKCIVCHSGETAAVGLRLDSYDAILKGSSRGPVVDKASAEDSELIRRIKTLLYDEGYTIVGARKKLESEPASQQAPASEADSKPPAKKGRRMAKTAGEIDSSRPAELKGIGEELRGILGSLEKTAELLDEKNAK